MHAKQPAVLCGLGSPSLASGSALGDLETLSDQQPTGIQTPPSTLWPLFPAKKWGNAQLGYTVTSKAGTIVVLQRHKCQARGPW
jgi:hypothetical protein